MKFGAIDIGSNAVRLLIADIIEDDAELYIKKISLIRVPIRLGATVFETGKISLGASRKLAKTMKAYRLLMDVYGVKGFRACATSAMRESENSVDVVNSVRQFSGINIEIINGQTEANLIFSTFQSQRLNPKQTYLYIDVGGGSTEITLLKNGKRQGSRSFKIGTVRLLKKKVKPELWDEMRAWVAKVAANEKDMIAIGTGGNVNRYFKQSGLTYGELLDFGKLEAMHAAMKKMTLKERILKLRMRPDRADVIVPAGDIYIEVLRTAGVKYMSVPQMGLSDGIALYLYKQFQENKKTVVRTPKSQLPLFPGKGL